MASAILDYIGAYIKAHNSYFNSFKVNGVQTLSGEVIEFTDGQEKKFIGISDNFGTAGYIRFNPQITHQANERRLTSSSANTGSFLKQCRLVAFSWDKSLSSEQLMTKLISDLKKTPFSNQTGRPQIIIKKSNHNYTDNITEECKKEAKDIGGYSFICISIDFDLKYFAGECEMCDPYDPDNGYVLIINQDGDVIARKSLGETYTVEQLQAVIDTITGNSATIIDPID